MRSFWSELDRRRRACRAARAAVLVEWEDEGLARFIAASPGLDKLCHYAGANRTIVSQNQLTAFRRAVKKLGFLLPEPC